MSGHVGIHEGICVARCMHLLEWVYKRNLMEKSLEDLLLHQIIVLGLTLVSRAGRKEELSTELRARKMSSNFLPSHFYYKRPKTS